MTKKDPALGTKVLEHLLSLGLEWSESDLKQEQLGYHSEHAREFASEGIYNAMHALRLPMTNDSLQDTPQRFADMLVDELCWGIDYDNFPKCTLFKNDRTQYDEMVLVKDIETISLCEHHLQTIYGETHIAYIPGKHCIGLSKLARITEFFARRPQVQERMTPQIHAALTFILKTEDVAVVQSAVHFCMKARGVQQSNARTVTSKMGGRFMSNKALRKEFFDAVR